jgi:hypothetical protein
MSAAADFSFFARDASAVIFGGRITSIEAAPGSTGRIPTNYTFAAPNLSCALSPVGGRAQAAIDAPVRFDVGGQTVASLARGQADVYDREVNGTLWVYSHVRGEGLRIGLDRKFTLELGEAEMVTSVRGNERTFELRKAIVLNAEFDGQPFEVTFDIDQPVTHKELQKKYTKGHASLLKDPDEYLEFHIVKTVVRHPEKCKQLGPNRFELPNFGKVEFGIMQAGDDFRQFTLARFTFGSPFEGVAAFAAPSTNGHG